MFHIGEHNIEYYSTKMATRQTLFQLAYSTHIIYQWQRAVSSTCLIMTATCGLIQVSLRLI